MAGLIYSGTIEWTQNGVQAIQGILFLFVSENVFSPMYSVLSIFPQMFPIFLREIKSGLYTTDQFYIANVMAMVIEYVLHRKKAIYICCLFLAARTSFRACDLHYYRLLDCGITSHVICICHNSYCIHISVSLINFMK